MTLVVCPAERLSDRDIEERAHSAKSAMWLTATDGSASVLTSQGLADWWTQSAVYTIVLSVCTTDLADRVRCIWHAVVCVCGLASAEL